MGIYDGKVVLVTGGAGGFGSGVTRRLAAGGAKVVVTDVNTEAARALAEEVGGMSVPLDVTDYQANLDAVAFVERHYGGLDTAFLNAGISTGCGIGEDFDLALYRKANGVNLDGVVFGAHAVAAAMKRRGGGQIVATASLAGLTAASLDPVYCGNKHAVVGLVRALGPTLAGDGIRISGLCPGFADTGIVAPIKTGLEGMGIPIMTVATVVDAVEAILASDGVGGECWLVQAGHQAAPYRFRGVPGARVDENSAPASAASAHEVIGHSGMR